MEEIALSSETALARGKIVTHCFALGSKCFCFSCCFGIMYMLVSARSTPTAAPDLEVETWSHYLLRTRTTHQRGIERCPSGGTSAAGRWPGHADAWHLCHAAAHRSHGRFHSLHVSCCARACADWFGSVGFLWVACEVAVDFPHKPAKLILKILIGCTRPSHWTVGGRMVVLPTYETSDPCMEPVAIRARLRSVISLAADAARVHFPECPVEASQLSKLQTSHFLALRYERFLNELDSLLQRLRIGALDEHVLRQVFPGIEFAVGTTTGTLSP
mmetsp:Transcript_23898/g.46575  ORF Transcript_23898/g.46575 Transcript_23898/m.46575 type:complete len:273 (+) Transcript_23898:712-1530(+)